MTKLGVLTINSSIALTIIIERLSVVCYPLAYYHKTTLSFCQLIIEKGEYCSYNVTQQLLHCHIRNMKSPN